MVAMSVYYSAKNHAIKITDSMLNYFFICHFRDLIQPSPATKVYLTRVEELDATKPYCTS